CSGANRGGGTTTSSSVWRGVASTGAFSVTAAGREGAPLSPRKRTPTPTTTTRARALRNLRALIGVHRWWARASSEPIRGGVPHPGWGAARPDRAGSGVGRTGVRRDRAIDTLGRGSRLGRLGALGRRGTFRLGRRLGRLHTLGALDRLGRLHTLGALDRLGRLHTLHALDTLG